MADSNETQPVAPDKPADDAASVRPEAARKQEHGGPKGPPAEYNGPQGPEPTRYGDWEKKGRCIDF